jgi:DNA-binding MarR family transcriptional regulator
LESNPDAKSSDVAKHINASLSATTQLIDRMHKSGLIDRKGDDNDRRVILLSVTQAGLDHLKHSKEAKRERMKELLSKLTKEEIKQLITIQEKLLNK